MTTNPNRPGWSARHYHAVLKIWRVAHKNRDRELLAQCQRAIDWLLNRMTSITDRRRIEGTTGARRRASRKKEYQGSEKL